MQKKILSFDDLIKKTEELKKQGKRIVQSHGVYDIIHPGIIHHLKLAKEQGDILVVTIIKDKDVRLGPGRPLFNEKLRLDNVVEINSVDYVALVDEETPFQSIRLLKPDIFAKGKVVRERDEIVHDELFNDNDNYIFEEIKIFETNGFSFNTQHLVNNFLEVYPDETKDYIKKIKVRYSLPSIVKKINELKKLKVLLIGDGIIDEYHYCDPMGKSAKTPLIVNKYINHELFAGGAFAIANHLADLCGKIKLVSLIGKDDNRRDFILNNLKPNVDPKLFFSKKNPTIVKKRYISRHHNQKIFEVNFINDEQIDNLCESQILKFLNTEIPKYDLVLISDFGHGLITPKIINLVQKKSKIFAVNTQTNAANAGFNLITKYLNPFFICLDEPEIRLAQQNKYDDIRIIAADIKASVKAENLIVTLGKSGSLGIGHNNEIDIAPIFPGKVIDTIGAGDAFFSFTAPCLASGMPIDLVLFIGNVVGALAVQIVGNKKPVEKHEVVEFIHNVLK